MADEVELSESGRDGYEVIPITPIRRLERKISNLEKAGSIPQLQSLIGQIIELVKGNQKLIDSIVHADAELRNEISKLPPKIDDQTRTMREFINLIEAAGRDEISTPGPEAFKPLVEQFKKIVEQNAKMIENDQAILESLDNIGRKMRSGTPVSKLLSSYPQLKMKRGVQ
jgi:hypothetical protein